jgi:hypothetical protein
VTNLPSPGMDGHHEVLLWETLKRTGEHLESEFDEIAGGLRELVDQARDLTQRVDDLSDLTAQVLTLGVVADEVRNGRTPVAALVAKLAAVQP